MSTELVVPAVGEWWERPHKGASVELVEIVDIDGGTQRVLGREQGSRRPWDTSWPLEVFVKRFRRVSGDHGIGVEVAR